MKQTLTILMLLVMAVGCSDTLQDEKLLEPQGFKSIEIEGCEYLQYDAQMYCGHQYTHHTYNARLLTHKGNCKNHKN